MSEKLCFPVCQACRETCNLITKSKPSEKRKYKWSPDEVRLECGTEILMPLVHLSYKGKYWCDWHNKYEKPIAKPKAVKQYPEEPLF